MCACGLPYVDVNMCPEYTLGPIVTWYTLFITVIYLYMCLMTSAAYKDEFRDGPAYPTYFIPQPQNVTFSEGQTAILRCSIENLGKKGVVWRRASEPNPISVGNFIFSPDKRYNVSISQEHRQYDLHIHKVTKHDSGVYECQVSSVDKLIRLVMLTIKVKPSPIIVDQPGGNAPQFDSTHQPYITPEIVLTGKEFLNSGETMKLVCNISGVSAGPDQTVDWYKDGNPINEHKSSKMAISRVVSRANRNLYSVLTIRHSKHDDTGTYVCRNSALLIASHKVTILNEEKAPRADRGTAGDATSGQICNKQWWTLFFTMMMSSLITKSIFYLR